MAWGGLERCGGALRVKSCAHSSEDVGLALLATRLDASVGVRGGPGFVRSSLVRSGPVLGATLEHGGRAASRTQRQDCGTCAVLANRDSGTGGLEAPGTGKVKGLV